MEIVLLFFVFFRLVLGEVGCPCRGVGGWGAAVSFQSTLLDVVVSGMIVVVVVGHVILF